MVILVIMLLQCLIGSASEDVSRVHYGVVFKSKGKMTMLSDTWTHTFQVKIPDMVKWEPIISCKTSKTLHCSPDEQIAKEINIIRKTMVSELQHTILTINEMIPEMRVGRVPKSLQIIGQLANSLFGTATQGEIDTLTKHINMITSTVNKLSGSFAREQGNFGSALGLIDVRFDNVMESINETRSITYNLVTAMQKEADKEAFLDEIILNQTEITAELRNKLSKLSVAVASLVQGRIPPYLVEPKQMRSAIIEISKHLKLQNPLYKLAITAPQYYYSYEKFIYSRKGSFLYIAIQFPITFHDPFKLFKVLTFEIPVATKTNDSSSLVLENDYFLISERDHLYATTSKQIINGCIDGKIKLCPDLKMAQFTSKSSCLTELYSGRNLSLIKDLCDYRFKRGSIVPKIQEITPSQLALYQVKSLKMNCDGQDIIEEGCEFCLKRIPCHCTVDSNENRYGGFDDNCGSMEENVTKVTTYYPINMGLLMHYFNHSYLSSLMKNLSFKDPISTLVPQFKIYEHSISNILADDKAKHLSIRKMVEQTKKNKVIFSNLADMMVTGNVDMNEGISTWNILTIFTLCLSILHTLVVIYLGYRMRVLTSVYLLAANHVQASQITLKYEISTTQQPLNIIEQLQETMRTEHYNLILSILMCISLVILIYYIMCILDRRNSYLMLHVTNGLICTDIKLHRIRVCLSEFETVLLWNVW